MEKIRGGDSSKRTAADPANLRFFNALQILREDFILHNFEVETLNSQEILSKCRRVNFSDLYF